MPLELRALAKNTPYLRQVVDDLVSCIDRTEAGPDVPDPFSYCDLSSCIVVTSTARAGRRLLDLLVGHCMQEQKLLLPPRFVTLTALHDLLLADSLEVQDRVLASPLQRQMALMRVLQALEAADRELLLPDSDAKSPASLVLALAQRIDAVFQELGGAGADFARLQALLEARGLEQEAERWTVLEEIAQRLEQLLEEHGLRSRVAASLECIASEHPLLPGQQLVLIGCVDLAPLLRRLLSKAQGIAYCIGETSLYESDGSLRWEALSKQQFFADQAQLFSDSKLILAPTPEDTLSALFAALAKDKPNLRADQLSLGISSTALAALAEVQARSMGVVLHSPEAGSLAQVALGRLPAELGRFFSEASPASFVALLQNPVLEAWWQAKTAVSAETLLESSDDYFVEMLPYRVLSQDFSCTAQEPPPLAKALAAFESLRQQYCSRPPRALSTLASQLRELLMGLLEPLGADAFPADPALTAAAQALQTALTAFEKLPVQCCPEFEFVEALELLTQQLSAMPLAQSPSSEAVEMLGWLELVLDDAPYLLILGLNEGLVPEAPAADAFLPNSIRAELGLVDDRHRLQRDSYVLWASCRCRQQYYLGASRVNQRAEPILLSRVLLADAPSAVARRLRRFYGVGAAESPTEASDTSSVRCALLATQPEEREWPPRPAPLQAPLDTLAITGFRDYLACPYRFYLKHVLKLKAFERSALELGPAAYGVLVHKVLQRMAQRFPRGSVASAEVREYVEQQLRALQQREFATQPQPALGFQLEYLLERVWHVAMWHRERLAEGWEVRELEWSFSGEAGRFVVDGVPITLRGRVDRIEYHPQLKKYAILDYKTAQRAQSPERAHATREGVWHDVQLPLYEHLLRAAFSLAPETQIELGFVQVSERPQEIGLRLAKWTEDDLQAARHCAADVVRAIRAQRFWPPSTDVLRQDPFARLMTIPLAEESPYAL